MEKVSLKQNLKYYDGITYSYYDITFSVTICRQLLYYSMYFIIPGTLIALMASIMFLLPLDCSERVTVGKKYNLIIYYFETILEYCL